MFYYTPAVIHSLVNERTNQRRETTTGKHLAAINSDVIAVVLSSIVVMRWWGQANADSQQILKPNRTDIGRGTLVSDHGGVPLNGYST